MWDPKQIPKHFFPHRPGVADQFGFEPSTPSSFANNERRNFETRNEENATSTFDKDQQCA